MLESEFEMIIFDLCLSLINFVLGRYYIPPKNCETENVYLIIINTV